MALLLTFSVCLLVAVLISGVAHRTVLSTAVLFLTAGLLLGQGGLGAFTVRTPVVSGVAEVALFSVLFTDGMRAGLDDLRGAWREPGRALLLGLPLTLLGIASLGVLVVGLPWGERCSSGRS